MMEKAENKVVLRASDLDGYLTDADRDRLDAMNREYEKTLDIFGRIEQEGGSAANRDRMIERFNAMGDLMQRIIGEEERIHVYSFETPRPIHGEASRLIAKLRDVRTQRPEFVYYIQRAYELLFNFAFTNVHRGAKNHIIVKTPVNEPVTNYAVHKIPDIDGSVVNGVMCVMLRGALLPSIIMSKEIQEYSSNNYLTPFALFKIARDDTKQERDMEYILNLERSYFEPDLLDGKDLFFADPMNATGGSLVTIITYLREQGIRPRSISFFNVISVLKGALRIIRAVENVRVYTLWMDPVLNRRAYILPGLGDAGDRINGPDEPGSPRNIIQLIAEYGSAVTALYRDQLRKIEETVLG